MPKDPVDSMGHNQKGWIRSISTDFVLARGNLAERRRLKDVIKEACRIIGVPWRKACEWFREAVRDFESMARTELEKAYRGKLALFNV